MTFAATQLDNLGDVMTKIANYFTGCDGYLSALRDAAPPAESGYRCTLVSRLPVRFGPFEKSGVTPEFLSMEPNQPPRSYYDIDLAYGGPGETDGRDNPSRHRREAPKCQADVGDSAIIIHSRGGSGASARNLDYRPPLETVL
jgi:hypothetical protein